MMRASSCVTLPGTTHASIEYSPVAVISCVELAARRRRGLRLAVREVDAPAADPAVTSPDSVRSAAGSTPLVSNAMLPWPVLNSYSAITLFRSGCRRSATVPSISVSALLVTRFGSTCVGGICVGHRLDYGLHHALARVRRRNLLQQLWDSLAEAHHEARLRRIVEIDLRNARRSVRTRRSSSAGEVRRLRVAGRTGGSPTQYSCSVRIVVRRSVNVVAGAVGREALARTRIASAAARSSSICLPPSPAAPTQCWIQRVR